jgi:hypothetical protein
MIETKRETITWHLCDKPLGYHEEDGKETENEYWRKGDPYYDLPAEDGVYLVTYADGEVGIEEYAEGSFDGYTPGDEIIAWAELPKGCKRETTK